MFRKRNTYFHRIVGISMLLIVLPLYVYGQQSEVPLNIQLSLITKILTFDRSQKHYADGRLVIGVLYQKKFHVSLAAKDQLLTYASTDTVRINGQVTIQWTPVEVNDYINTIVENSNVDVLYITPMRGVEIEPITKFSRSNHILTITGILPYVERGISVGIGSKGEKPVIYVNLNAAKAEGADFNSNFLKMTHIVGEDPK